MRLRRKRKRLRKLIMGLKIPRDNAEFYIDIGLMMDLNYSDQLAAVNELIKERKAGTQCARQLSP